MPRIREETEREETFDGVYLFNLRVAPAVRYRGIAKLLIRTALEMETSHPHAFAYVRTDNLASRRLFESLGFRAESVTHHLRVFGMSSYQTEELRAYKNQSDRAVEGLELEPIYQHHHV